MPPRMTASWPNLKEAAADYRVLPARGYACEKEAFSPGLGFNYFRPWQQDESQMSRLFWKFLSPRISLSSREIIRANFRLTDI
jgi:hypothetical protein